MTPNMADNATRGSRSFIQRANLGGKGSWIFLNKHVFICRLIDRIIKHSLLINYPELAEHFIGLLNRVCLTLESQHHTIPSERRQAVGLGSECQLVSR